MPFPAAYLLIAGGVCACAPLFKRISNALGRVLSAVGFFIGIGVIIVAADIAILASNLSSPSTADLIAANSYLRYYLPVMLVLGILLVARPIRNIRWASLVGLGVGLLASYYIKVFLPGLSSTILIVVFLVVTVAIYSLLRFVEDIFEFIGQVLAFPPIAVGIGLVALYFGIVIATSFP